MKIFVVTGTGTGKTSLSAFDSALKNAGVYNYNLITLSSIIPPKSKIVTIDKYRTDVKQYGDRLYVVKAEMRSQQVGKFISAGIGWYQYDDGRGVLVEHEEIGETKVAVESEINFKIVSSLHDLCRHRKIKFHDKDFKQKIIISQVIDQPCCVLVLAVFQSQKWDIS